MISHLFDVQLPEVDSRTKFLKKGSHSGFMPSVGSLSLVSRKETGVQLRVIYLLY